MVGDWGEEAGSSGVGPVTGGTVWGLVWVDAVAEVTGGGVVGFVWGEVKGKTDTGVFEGTGCGGGW